MIICIPTNSDEGLRATVAGHAGRAPFLTLVDTESGKTEVLPNAAHADRSCAPTAALKGTNVQELVCGGAGKLSVASLQRAGIRVLLTTALRAEDALAEWRQGGLPVLGARDACGGFQGGRGLGRGRGSRGIDAAADSAGKHRRRRGV